MSAPLPPPPPPPRGHDSSSSSGGGGGGYTPPPPPTPPNPPTTNAPNVVVGPNKLTATNNDHNYILHHQHPSQTPPPPPPFDQIATGAGHQHHHQHQQQQQPPLLKVHNRNEPPPPQQQHPTTTTIDRWSTMLPMYHHHHHHRPPLDSHSLPLETTRPEFNTRPADKDTFTGTINTKYDHRGRDKDAYFPEFKEGYTGPAGINWKDSKDHYRVPPPTPTPPPPPPPPLTKRAHTDTTSGAVPNNSDTWDALRSNLHTPVQAVLTVHERDYVDSQEAVAENRVDSKGEDRNKDKDRKRKDLKHRDWGGERDKDRIERRTNLQLGSGSAEGIKEPSAREDDRWDREKKDFSKDREKSKEMEKDPVKRETWNGGPEKDGLNSEKEPSMDISGRTPERETSTSEQKKPKDHDGWRTADREGRERRKERDGDVEPERPEKRSRGYDKESDDGCADPDGGTEKDREGFSYGVQQRKRMLRPRGSPQVGNREPRFRPRAQDNEGAQGKPEVSTVVYRVGECMQELIKLWKEYESSQADKNGEYSQASPTLEIRIPAEFISATNRQVRGGQLWGTDLYTDDSDLVAVLMHTGYCRPTASPPPPAIQELRATVRVLPPQDCYTSTLRNNVRSRAWGAAIGCSYRVEHCCIFKKGGGTIDLEPCLTHTSTVEPTLAPVAVERTMTTRAAASNALRQQRFVREVTIQYNLCNEPWIKYSLSVVADKGLKKPLYTSARLKKGEVLYLETHTRRYELCFSGEKMVKAAISSQARDMDVEKTRCLNLHSMDGEKERGGLLDGDTVPIDVFRWSRCKRPLPQNLLRSSGIPLPSEHLEVLEENLDWEDIQWSQTGVFIAGKEYALARLHFMSPN